MNTSFLRTPLARALILTFSATALAGYVAMVSCARTSSPPAPSPPLPQQAAQVANPAAENPAASPKAPQPARPAMPHRIYGPATKSDIMIRPRPEPQPQQSPAQNVSP